MLLFSYIKIKVYIFFYIHCKEILIVKKCWLSGNINGDAKKFKLSTKVSIKKNAESHYTRLKAVSDKWHRINKLRTRINFIISSSDLS